MSSFKIISQFKFIKSFNLKVNTTKFCQSEISQKSPRVQSLFPEKTSPRRILEVLFPEKTSPQRILEVLFPEKTAHFGSTVPGKKRRRESSAFWKYCSRKKISKRCESRSDGCHKVIEHLFSTSCHNVGTLPRLEKSNVPTRGRGPKK